MIEQVENASCILDEGEINESYISLCLSFENKEQHKYSYNLYGETGKQQLNIMSQCLERRTSNKKRLFFSLETFSKKKIAIKIQIWKRNIVNRDLLFS